MRRFFQTAIAAGRSWRQDHASATVDGTTLDIVSSTLRNQASAVGSNLSVVQTRQSLSVSALSLANQSQQSVLQLLR